MVAWRITSPSRRRVKVLLNVSAQLLCLGWLLLMLNGWVFYHSWPLDLTDDDRFTLPPETLTLLETLEAPVEVVIPFQFSRDLQGILEKKVFERARRVLHEMERAAFGNLRVSRQVEVGSNRDEWQLIQAEYKIETINRIYLIATDRREVLAPSDLAVFRSANELDPGETAQLISENVVEALTVALRRVVQEDRPKIRITQGHGEMPMEVMSTFTQDLLERGFEVEALNLRDEPVIPEDTDLLLIACQGPQGFDGFGRDVVTVIDAFVATGGRLFVTLPLERPTGLESLLSQHGIDVLPGFVAHIGMDTRGLSRATPLFSTPYFNPSHSITRQFESVKDRAHFYVSRALDGAASTLLMSEEECWLESSQSPTLRRDAGEDTGQFRVALASAGDVRIVVFGAVFATYDKWYSGVSRQVLLNSIFWLTNQETLSSAALSNAESRVIRLDARTQAAFFWTSIFVIPACSVLAGLLAAWIRRR